MSLTRRVLVSRLTVDFGSERCDEAGEVSPPMALFGSKPHSASVR